MKFIIDENITPDVVKIFNQYHLKAYHVNDLKKSSTHRIADDRLRALSLRKGCIIVTKDDGFVKSYVDRKVPHKMLFIYGLDRKELLMDRFKEIAPTLSEMLKKHDFVEITTNQLKFPFS